MVDAHEPGGDPQRLIGARAGRGECAALAALALVYIGTRTYRLTELPMFFDEAIHLLWAQRWSGPEGVAHAMQDGKLLQVVASAATLRLFSDPVWACRFATVLAGALGAAVAWALGRRLGGAAGGLLTAVLVVSCPFLLFHERMALADGFVSALAALVLLLTVRACEQPRPTRGFLLGLALAAATTAKMLGVFSFAIPAVGVVLLARRDGRAWRTVALAWGVAGALVAWPAFVFWRSGGQISDKAALVSDERLSLVARNVALTSSWLWTYWTAPVVLLGLAASLLALVRQRPAARLVAVAWLLPLGMLVPIATAWFPRYLVCATVPFLALAGGLLGEAWAQARPGVARTLVCLAAVAIVVPGGLFCARLLRDPATAPLPDADRFQYIEGWPSGYGWRESWAFLEQVRSAERRELRVATERQHWTLKAYFAGSPEVSVKSFPLDEPSWAPRVRTWVGAGGGWLVSSAEMPVGAVNGGLRLTSAARFPKPGGHWTVYVYRLDATDPATR